MVSQSNWQLEIRPRTNAAGSRYNGYLSDVAWNMLGGKASVEVVKTADEGAETIFALVKDGENWYRFVASGGTLSFQSSKSGQKISASHRLYSKTVHRYWRFRHESTGSILFWETSSDGAVWYAAHAETVEGPLRVRFELNAGTKSAAPSPGTAVFDNFHLSVP